MKNRQINNKQSRIFTAIILVIINFLNLKDQDLKQLNS